ncbi:MAG: hypothetical protein FJ387_22630 [Verrucomicrobia bacterium]|nr:hypothetical protein [Verrucomicrobiota bacterium]
MPPETFTFDLPGAWRIGAPLVLLVFGSSAWGYLRRGLSRPRALGLATLRAAAVGLLVCLAARPTWVSRAPPSADQRTVMLLVDQSESMSVETDGRTSYRQALDFARVHLLPALAAAGWRVQGFGFAADAQPADGAQMNAAAPKGRRTNLGRAIHRALSHDATPPWAVLALTDGIVNESADNARGLSALVENRVPFIGLAVGSDTGARTLSLRQVTAPNVVATNAQFRVSAELEANSDDELPPFDLVLMRDGKPVQQKTVRPGPGARLWLESFTLHEPAEGTHQYLVQFLPPAAPGLKCASTTGTAVVQVASDKELRVLYVQGALTWDYKFATLAVQDDPIVKLTGLTRTSKQSIFRQNVETAGELQYGFPTTLAEMAPFRVVVLASLAPADLSPAQQDLLARFCGDLGGGVLMIGGRATFNAAWQDSRLEHVLPVTFTSLEGVTGLDRPFRLEPTAAALAHPLFALAHDQSPREVWARLPTLTHYGRVEAAKPGAQVWAQHPDDVGPNGPRILMASQRFGAGRSAVLCVENLWRWRLAREADPAQFDRFWRQLLRFLGEPSRQDVVIQLADQELRPQQDVQLTLERRPQASDLPGAKLGVHLRVEDERQQTVTEQALELPIGQPVNVSFRPPQPGLFAVWVQDPDRMPLASRTVEIREVNVEFQETRRTLETLRQWASLSGGLACKVEECTDPAELVDQVRARVEELRRFNPTRRPAGMNGWILAAILTALAVEWVLRKKWLLT